MKVNVSAGSIALAVALVLSPGMVSIGAAPAATTVFVTNSNDDGPGSFRRAIAAANGNPSIARVVFLGHVTTIYLRAGVEYTPARSH